MIERRMRTTGEPILPLLHDIPAGDFIMGNEAGASDERPEHRVRIEAFRAAVAPVSNAEYVRFVEATGREPSRFADDPRFNDRQQPVVGVSWFDAAAYCTWLRELSGIGFRLPTEAEREWASLGGLIRADWPWTERHPLGDEIASLDRPHPPAPECANGYGLRCVAENVHEWCADWHDSGYYAVAPLRAPGGPSHGRRKASRGGSWRHRVKFTRLTARASLDPSFRYNDFGFRVYADGVS